MNMQVVPSGRLVCLTPFGTDDLTDAYIGWLNDPEVTRFSNQRFVRHDRASCAAYMASFAGTPNFFLSVKRLSDLASIGTITVYRNLHHGTADVGIMIGNRACWGGGYGQDAWSTVIEWLLADVGMRKVTAGTLADNIGMVRLMQRSGMVCEGIRQAQEIVDGAPCDVVLYARFAP